MKKISDKNKRIIAIFAFSLIVGALAFPAASSAVDMGWLNSFFDILSRAFESLASYIGSALSGFFQSLQSWLNPVLSWFGDKLHAIGQAMGQAVSSITGTLQNFWGAIKQFFATIFKPILDLVYGILYFIAQIFTVIKLVIILLANIFVLFAAIVMGFLNTILSLANWSGGSEYFSIYEQYSRGFNFVIQYMNTTGLNIMAGIAAVGVWIITAFASIKIVTGGR